MQKDQLDVLMGEALIVERVRALLHGEQCPMWGSQERRKCSRRMQCGALVAGLPGRVRRSILDSMFGPDSVVQIIRSSRLISAKS